MYFIWKFNSNDYIVMECYLIYNYKWYGNNNNILVLLLYVLLKVTFPLLRVSQPLPEGECKVSFGLIASFIDLSWVLYPYLGPF